MYQFRHLWQVQYAEYYIHVDSYSDWEIKHVINKNKEYKTFLKC